MHMLNNFGRFTILLRYSLTARPCSASTLGKEGCLGDSHAKILLQTQLAQSFYKSRVHTEVHKPKCALQEVSSCHGNAPFILDHFSGNNHHTATNSYMLSDTEKSKPSPEKSTKYLDEWLKLSDKESSPGKNICKYQSIPKYTGDEVVKKETSQVFLEGDSNRESDQGKGGKEEKDPLQPSLEQLLFIQEFLNEEVPRVFLSSTHFHHTDKNVVFVNNWVEKPYITRDFFSYYKEVMKARMYFTLKYANRRVHVLKSTLDEENGTVTLRWQVVALPGMEVLKVWKYFPGSFWKTVDDNAHYYDGLSTYYVNSRQLIYKHQMERVIPDVQKGKLRTSFVQKLLARVAKTT